MAQARIPGSLGLERNKAPAGARDLPNALGPGRHSTKGGAAPGPIGLVKSAKEMKELIEGGTWDVIIYFGHGVENQMALAPQEGGRILKKEELVQALQKAQVKKVYLFGCKAGLTGLARALSKDVPGATVYGTFGSLDVDWEQRKDPDGTFTNKFDFKEPLTEYTGGFQTKDGKKTKQRRHERGDPITVSDDPLGGEPMVDQ